MRYQFKLHAPSCSHRFSDWPGSSPTSCRARQISHGDGAPLHCKKHLLPPGGFSGRLTALRCLLGLYDRPRVRIFVSAVVDRSEMYRGYVNGRQSAYLFRLNLCADLDGHKWPVVEHAEAHPDQVTVRHLWLAVGLEHLVRVILDCGFLNKQRQPHREMQRNRDTDRETERQR